MAITLAHHNDIIIYVLRMTELFLQFRRLLKLPNVSVHERVMKCFKTELINGKTFLKTRFYFNALFRAVPVACPALDKRGSFFARFFDLIKINIDIVYIIHQSQF